MMKTTEELKTVPFEMYARVLARAESAEKRIAELEAHMTNEYARAEAWRDHAEQWNADARRLSGCLLAIHEAKEDVPASVLRSIAYDAALNCITPDVAAFQIVRRAALNPSPTEDTARRGPAE